MPGTKSKTRSAAVPEFADGAEFDALTDEEKERVWQDCDREIPASETRPLSREERIWWEKIQAKLQANASNTVILRFQKRMLERLDAYGGDNGLTRHDVIVLAIHHLLTDKANGTTS